MKCGPVKAFIRLEVISSTSSRILRFTDLNSVEIPPPTHNLSKETPIPTLMVGLRSEINQPQSLRLGRTCVQNSSAGKWVQCSYSARMAPQTHSAVETDASSAVVVSAANLSPLATSPPTSAPSLASPPICAPPLRAGYHPNAHSPTPPVSHHTESEHQLETTADLWVVHTPARLTVTVSYLSGPTAGFSRLILASTPEPAASSSLAAAVYTPPTPRLRRAHPP